MKEVPEALEIEYGDRGPRWKSPEEMYSNGYISDRENNLLKKEREGLTRYVEVEIRDAASCERTSMAIKN